MPIPWLRPDEQRFRGSCVQKDNFAIVAELGVLKRGKSSLSFFMACKALSASLIATFSSARPEVLGQYF